MTSKGAVGERRQGREIALQLLYQWDVRRQPVAQLFGSFAWYEDSSAGSEAFARKLVQDVVHDVDRIDRLIAEHSQNWRMSRMALVDRNVMRIAVSELLAGETPTRVVINEALEVAKRFSAPDATVFGSTGSLRPRALPTGVAKAGSDAFPRRVSCSLRGRSPSRTGPGPAGTASACRPRAASALRYW